MAYFQIQFSHIKGSVENENQLRRDRKSPSVDSKADVAVVPLPKLPISGEVCNQSEFLKMFETSGAFECVKFILIQYFHVKLNAMYLNTTGEFYPSLFQRLFSNPDYVTNVFWAYLTENF